MKTIGILCGTIVMLFNGCSPSEPSDKETLGVVDLKVRDLAVHAWIADDNDERMKGLMHVTAEELSPLSDGRERGMVFLFPYDQHHGFWMKNTIISLDIAFIDVDGTIVQTFTMAALDERSYTPRNAYRYALEVNAGVFERFGIAAGDHIDIPDSLLKNVE